MRKLFIVSLILTACGNDVEFLERSPENGGVSVDLVYTGSLGVDGCEFFVDFQEVRYKPVNEELINEKYQNGTAQVNMEFEVQADSISYQCGLNPVPTVYAALKIISIED